MSDQATVRELEKIGLVYVNDNLPGIARRRAGRGFAYYDPRGKIIRDESVRNRINLLAIPPAYENVWICPYENGHIQATGVDARSRKQYRYHPQWAQLRDRTKFDKLLDFADALPRIRQRIKRDLSGNPGELDHTLAALAMLLDDSHVRIGTARYASQNGSYGATTLLKKHLNLQGSIIRLDFPGKGGKRVRRQLKNSRLHRILEEISDLPGRHLFSWRDDEGRLRPVDSAKLNAYLADAAGDDAITAKVFRTWAGTLAAYAQAEAVIAREEVPTIRAMTEAASEELSNTPAICRSSYIHPKVIALAEDPPDAEKLERVVSRSLPPSTNRLRKVESRLYGWLLNS